MTELDSIGLFVDSKDKQARGDITAYMDLLAKMNKKYEDLEDKELIREVTNQTSESLEIREKYRQMCRDRNDTVIWSPANGL